METAILKLADIRPAAYNPRIMLKQGDEEYEALKNSLERFGVATPLVVNRTTGNLVSGHQRLNVLKEMGVEKAEVVLIDVDADKEKLLNVALNKIDGEWDYGKLEELFAEFSDEDIQFTGYSVEEISGLFGKETSTAPSFDYEDDFDEETDSDGEDSEPKDEKPDKPEKDFKIFFSFPSKEAAEKWLKDKGQEHEFDGTSHNITIKMEGVEFGTRN
ncbi:MAG: ParB N-terminal domain-containing protein [Eubacterium sp.]|nr:ParB N-terminal domain-containing protein [Eubacterium sp.]